MDFGAFKVSCRSSESWNCQNVLNRAEQSSRGSSSEQRHSDTPNSIQCLISSKQKTNKFCCFMFAFRIFTDNDHMLLSEGGERVWANIFFLVPRSEFSQFLEERALFHTEAVAFSLICGVMFAKLVKMYSEFLFYSFLVYSVLMCAIQQHMSGSLIRFYIRPEWVLNCNINFTEISVSASPLLCTFHRS